MREYGIPEVVMPEIDILAGAEERASGHIHIDYAVLAPEAVLAVVYNRYAALVVGHIDKLLAGHLELRFFDAVVFGGLSRYVPELDIEFALVGFDIYGKATLSMLFLLSVSISVSKETRGEPSRMLISCLISVFPTE